MPRPTHILACDCGDTTAWAHFQGRVYIASGEVHYRAGKNNPLHDFREQFELALSRAGIGPRVDVLAVESMRIYRKQSDVLRAAYIRGVVVSSTACARLYQPAKPAWCPRSEKTGKYLTDSEIRKLASRIAGKKIRSIHEAEAILMAAWAAEKEEARREKGGA